MEGHGPEHAHTQLDPRRGLRLGPARRDALPADGSTPIGERSHAAAPKPHAIDIENHLDSFPGADHLNWRTSVADLMTLIGVDSSPEARAALARELGYEGPADGSPEMDNWLHARVMADLADQGGAVPPEFGEN